MQLLFFDDTVLVRIQEFLQFVNAFLKLLTDVCIWKKQKYSMYELPVVRDYRDGKVSRAQLDACSTCDFSAPARDGLSQSSREQLRERSGEEIVDADIAAQLGGHDGPAHS